jgi:hypothetical protein
MTHKLTERENSQLIRFQEGMDDENEGWLHEMAVFEGRELSGIIISLNQKGVIQSGPPIGCWGDAWVEVMDPYRI